jgi:2-phosphosulfolactate phosphatase
MEMRLEWGPTGAAALAPECDIAVVSDVLTFSTTVSVAADQGVSVVPYRWADTSAADKALARDAVLAVARHEAGVGDVSLSPETFRAASGLRRVVLPSPNGATVCAVLAEAGRQVVVASLRNRLAVAAYLARHGGRILLVPPGERWPDGSLRPAIEDLWGAGGIAAALEDLGLGEATDEAKAAAQAYRTVEHRVGDALLACPSGQELIGWGYASDVTIAAELDTSDAVPVLVDGELVAR